MGFVATTYVLYVGSTLAHLNNLCAISWLIKTYQNCSDVIIISFILSCSTSDIELNACAQRFLHVTLMRPMLLMIGIAIACRKSIAIMIEVMIAFMMINYNCDQRHAGHQVDTFSLEMKMSVVRAHFGMIYGGLILPTAKALPHAGDPFTGV